MRLEEVLVIKELHLVRQNYTDLFFLHRKNDKTKAIRAIAQVPVVVTAYLDLKDIQWTRRNDSIKQVLLPKARLGDPTYALHEMQIQETRGFQVHVGNDLYPKVSQYLTQTMAQRIDSVKQRAVANKILLQAEAEGKQYIEELLKKIGRTDIVVTFGDEAEDKAVAALALQQPVPHDTTAATKAGTATAGMVGVTMTNALYQWVGIE